MSRSSDIDATVIAALSVALPRLEGVTVLRDAPLSQCTALRVGGPADLLVHVETPSSLAAATELMKRVKCPWRVVWPFHPHLPKDGGLNGVAITLGAAFEGMDTTHDGHVVLGAATPFAALVAAGEGFATLATWPGTPGSLLDAGQAELLAGPCAAITAVTSQSVRRRTFAATSSPTNPSRSTTPVSVELRPVPPAAPAPLPPGQLLEPDGPLAEVGGTAGEVAKAMVSSGLPESRLRGWTLSVAWPGLVVQSGEGTTADLELFARALSEKLHRERGMVTKTAPRTYGRTASKSGARSSR